MLLDQSLQTEQVQLLVLFPVEEDLPAVEVQLAPLEVCLEVLREEGGGEGALELLADHGLDLFEDADDLGDRELVDAQVVGQLLEDDGEVAAGQEVLTDVVRLLGTAVPQLKV